MRLATWNIQWGLGMDGRVDLAGIVAHARTLADVDVLCLQEVSDAMPDLQGSGGIDQFAAIAALLPGFAAVSGAGVELPDEAGPTRRFGNMILSRLPVRQVVRHQLPWIGGPGPSMPRLLLEVLVDAPAGPVRVMTTHLEYSSPQARARQVQRIREIQADAVDRADRPRRAGAGPYATPPAVASAILCGDFNMKPDDPALGRLLGPAGGFADAWTTRHPGTPHPPSFCITDGRYGPPHCADYVLVTPDLAPRVTCIAYDTETRLSDHQPVVLELA